MSCGLPMLGGQKGVADHFRDLRDDGIAKASKAVHPLGYALGYTREGILPAMRFPVRLAVPCQKW